MLCCGYTLTDFPISIRLTSLALWQSNDCPSDSKTTLMNMDKYFMWIQHERLHNHNKAKHNKTVCIFLGIYCSLIYILHMPLLRYMTECHNDKKCYKVDGGVHCTLGKMWKWDNCKLIYYRCGNPALAAVVLLPVSNYLWFKFYNASKSSISLWLWKIEQLGRWYKEYANCRGGKQTWASLH